MALSQRPRLYYRPARSDRPRSLNVRGVPFVAHNGRVEPTVGRLLQAQPTNGRLYVCGTSRGRPCPSGPGCITGLRDDRPRSLNVCGVSFVAHDWRVEQTVGRLLPMQPTNGRLYVCGTSRGWPCPSGPGCITGSRALTVRDPSTFAGFRVSRNVRGVSCVAHNWRVEPTVVRLLPVQPTTGRLYVCGTSRGWPCPTRLYYRPARSDRPRSLNVRAVSFVAHNWRVEPTVGRLLPVQPTNGRLYRGSRGCAYPCGPGISPTVSPSQVCTEMR